MAIPPVPTGVKVLNPLTLKDLDIEWDPITEPSAMIIGFNVFRSESPKEDTRTKFEKVNTELVLTTFFRDSSLRLRLARKFFYVVTAVNLDGESGGSVAATHSWEALSCSMRARVAEIVRRNNIMLNNEAANCDLFTVNRAKGLKGFPNVTNGIGKGEEVIFYIRKTAGELCSCFNFAKKQAEEDCPLCFGTIFENGYIRFGEMMMSFSLGPEIIAMTETGLIQDKNPTAWISNFPYIKTGDVVRRQDAKMFEVMGSNRATFQGLVTKQTVTLKELPTTLSIYKIDEEEAVGSAYGGS